MFWWKANEPTSHSNDKHFYQKKGAASPLLVSFKVLILIAWIYAPDDAPPAPPIFWTISMSFWIMLVNCVNTDAIWDIIWS